VSDPELQSHRQQTLPERATLRAQASKVSTDGFRWRQMIVTADWVSQDMFDQAVANASERLGEPPRGLRIERFAEGECVQIMHTGPENEEAVTVMARLHNEFLPERELVAHGCHHEIYLTDPKRVAPETLRTALRQPVKHR
jgi:hypothetical protein